MLAPSGGSILSSPAKKEYGKKDAAKGRDPAFGFHPCIRHRYCGCTWYGVPGKLVAASVPCERVSRPLAAALLLTHCISGLIAFFGAGSCCVLIFSMQAGWRPPGAIFFLHRRRKNMERKTPLRAGAPALRTHPLGGGREYSRTLYGVPNKLVTASVVRPGEQTACRCACAYDAGCGLASRHRGNLFR